MRETRDGKRREGRERERGVKEGEMRDTGKRREGREARKGKGRRGE